MLRFVATLTRTPAGVAAPLVEAVFAAGWDEQALHDATMVCALFNLMNRMVEGHGITADAAYYARSGRRLRDVGYRGLVALLDEGTAG